MSLLARASTSSAIARGASALSARTFVSSAIALKRAKTRKPVVFDASARQPAEWRTELDEREQALLSSTPLSVRERRTARGIPEEKMTADGVTVVERLEYEKRRARGDFLDTRAWPNGEPTPREWVDFMNARRNRIRGRKLVPAAEDAHAEDPDSPLPQQVEEIVGRPVYLPDIVMRLIPNHTPPGQSYNPWEATFYISHHGVTKTDIRSYLWAMYGLEVTYIRTDNYYAPIKQRPGRPKSRPTKGIALKSRKRAVVGLKSPFFFPNMREDMTAEERAVHTEVIDQQVAMTAQIEDRAKQQRTQLGMKPEAWQNRVMGKKNVMADRKARRDHAEQNVQNTVQTMIEAAVEAGTYGKATVRPDQIPLPAEK